MEEKPKPRASDTHQTGEPTSNVGQQNTSGNNPDSWGMGMGLRTPEDIAKDMLPVPSLHSGQTNEWASDTQSYSGVMQSDKDTLMREFQSQYTPNYMEYAFNQALDPYQGRLPLYASRAFDTAMNAPRPLTRWEKLSKSIEMYHEARFAKPDTAKIFGRGVLKRVGSVAELVQTVGFSFAEMAYPNELDTVKLILPQSRALYGDSPIHNTLKIGTMGANVIDAAIHPVRTYHHVSDHMNQMTPEDWVESAGEFTGAFFATPGIGAGPKALASGARVISTANKLLPTPNPLKRVIKNPYNFFGDTSNFTLRQERMLKKDVGYNISPEGWFNEHSTLGREGTFLTDYKAIGDVAGPIKANTKYDVSFFSSKDTVSYYKAYKLEKSLGLEFGTLKEGFRFSRISEIGEMNPRSPLEGNRFFSGPGMGLPGGGPEIVIDPVPTKPWPVGGS